MDEAEGSERDEKRRSTHELEDVAQNKEEEKEDGEENEPEETIDIRESKWKIAAGMQAISILQIPDIVEHFDPNSFPPSYKDNEPKEMKAIQYCTNFLYQYKHLCNHRSPVFLKPINEFGVEKLVCTTIVPTQLPFKELLDWPNIAEFVAGYLKYKKLRPPNLLPKTMFAPQTTLETLNGHCFEYSTVLCSMLIGAGYDAFVVSGYATKEVYTRPITLPVCRYTLRPPRQFKSEYELRMQKKRQEAIKREDDQAKEAKQKVKVLEEAPPPDHFYGHRIHSWVMVLKGARDVDKTFFIEPTTGVAHPTDCDQYLGIETLWNHMNYYINMQQYEIKGTDKLKYDIGDSCDWEYIFPGQDLHVQYTPEELQEKKKKIIMQGDNIAEELHMDLPMSWSKPLHITREDFSRKYPGGKKTRRYKYTIVDDYCRYLNSDGLVRKIRRYSDIPCEELSYTREIYRDRADMLESRFMHLSSGRVIENFGLGRSDFIREHIYLAHATEPEKWRIISYEPDKRVDGQTKREEDSTSIKQYFKDRDDRKYYKETKFGPKGKIFENPAVLSHNPRPIETIIECYNRNPSVPANSDIAKITFSVWLDEINIAYHVEDHRIVCSTRHFNKPPLWYDDAQILAWSSDLHWCFEADPFVRPKGELQLYQMLMELMAKEATSRNEVRKIEKEMKECLVTRQKEEDQPLLVMTYVQADTDENLRAERLKLKAQKKAETLLAKSDVLKDYLEPYIIQIGLQKISNRKQAARIRDDCMQSLKDRLIAQANIIKESFAKVELIDTAQQWYHSHFTGLTSQDISDYRTFLIQHMFIAHILERRLISLKEYAPIKYQALYDTLHKDPRLEPFLI